MFGQNRKKTWDDGTIIIFLDNDQIQYRTGSVIRGRIVVNQQKEFNCTELVVGIHGSEQTYFRLYESDNASIYCGKRPFIYKSFVVNSYSNNISPVGIHEFKFEFRTPEWLPNSTIYTATHASSIFNIRYGIFA